MGTEYVAELKLRAPDAKRITDKMPANFFAVGLIHLMLPNAKIIHVNRNPVDACLSCYTRLFNRKQEHTYNLAELGQPIYSSSMERWRHYEKFLGPLLDALGDLVPERKR